MVLLLWVSSLAPRRDARRIIGAIGLGPGRVKRLPRLPVALPGNRRQRTHIETALDARFPLSVIGRSALTAIFARHGLGLAICRPLCTPPADGLCESQ